MQPMRDFIQGSLARTLRRLPEEARLEAALPVVCGAAVASRCEVVRWDEHQVLHLRVHGAEWLRSVVQARGHIVANLQRVAGVTLTGLRCQEAATESAWKAARPTQP